MDEKDLIRKYRDLIQEYLTGEISASEFSLSYLEEFKNEESGLSEETFRILQNMFAEADAYCDDPDLRGELDIGEDELRETAIETKHKLDQLTEKIDR
jgi:hypothetical protein